MASRAHKKASLKDYFQEPFLELFPLHLFILHYIGIVVAVIKHESVNP